MPPTLYLDPLLWLMTGMLIGAVVALLRQTTRRKRRLSIIGGGLSALVAGASNFLFHLVSSNRFIYIGPLDWALSFTNLAIAAASALAAVLLLQMLPSDHHSVNRRK